MPFNPSLQWSSLRNVIKSINPSTLSILLLSAISLTDARSCDKYLVFLLLFLLFKEWVDIFNMFIYIQTALTAVRSKAVILLLLIYCLLYIVRDGTVFVLVLLCIILCPFYFSNHLEGEKTSCFVFIAVHCLVNVNVLWLFITDPWAGLQCVFMVFSDHTHLLFACFNKICLICMKSFSKENKTK